jgi:cytochrome c-type biogenesis protein CcmE
MNMGIVKDVVGVCVFVCGLVVLLVLITCSCNIDLFAIPYCSWALGAKVNI